MTDQKNGVRQKGSELYRELVPLAEATAVAYHIITEKPDPLTDAAELDEVRGLVAIALSTVAPIQILADEKAMALSPQQVEEYLFSPVSRGLRDRRAGLDFSALFIRRSDLIRAIETLKQAHATFGREKVLRDLKKR
jgi:hypothetical protein